MPRTKTIWVQPQYLRQILNGQKTVEVRVGYPNITRLQSGDVLLFNKLHPYQITAIRRYESLEDLVAAEEPTAIAPDLTDRAEVLEACQEIYGPPQEALGVFALEIAPAKNSA